MKIIKKLSKPEIQILLGIPVLFLIGGIWHFIYDVIPILPIAIIAPINDSVWEHMKMGLWPVISWWLIYYSVRKKQDNINKKAWFTAALSALVVTLLTLPLIFYFYRSAFGIPMGTPEIPAGGFSLIFDIFILLLANTFGQLLGLHLYRRYKGINTSIAIALTAFIVLSFVFFTFYQPQIPLFFDFLNDHFGLPDYNF
ncbi:MAG: DUF6512 family protein [Oscillospiraceae bacterium]|nr:DUF6512 family protein [Oscillospiraceae bacterium]